MSKSHVGMGHSVCPVCGIQHDEVVLLDKRLQKTLEPSNFMGFAPCPEHAALQEEYLALVECDNPNNGTHTHIRPESAHRTGKVCHVRRSVASRIFNVDLPSDLPMVFVEVGVISRIEEMQA